MATRPVPLEPMGPDLHERRPPHEDHYDDSSVDEEDDVDDFIAANEGHSGKGKAHSSSSKHARKRLFAAFMIFGLLNNVLYVIILSAALDLVSSATPKGIVALFNIFPALLTKVVWPLVSNGKIRYTRRVGVCTCVSWLGIMTIAFSNSLAPRLLGISMASLSSGLGELTFLQMTTTLPTRSTSKTALGAWSSGTGFAGIAGAGIWWLLRGLGVRSGLGLSSILPLFFPITYKFLLPSHQELGSMSSDRNLGEYQPISNNDDTVPPSIYITPPSQDPIPQLATSIEAEDNSKPSLQTRHRIHLSTKEKLDLLKPLVLRYMVPLCAVYVEEYVINSGVAPTLVFPLPTSGIWSKLFKSPRDYYPFWSLTYQTFVFLSRSSLSLSFPPIPLTLLPLPSIIQFLVLSSLYLQAKHFVFSTPSYTPPNVPPTEGVDRSISIVFMVICIEGLCGGLAYVNTFYHVAREGENEDDENNEKSGMQREFRIGAVGAADSTGILFASLISMPLELSLCNSQIEQGRTMCRDL
ncbi:protein BTN1 [Kwoniella mangroviensis CBS 10435]|uniref:Protein BTN n=1 Tax=Kwoniella mangroviensis CBS 10435 TaxID=1331196 RepID=A0A1B9IL09_9TREE|nr:protein BTN1 [Kwoniella mangroviensis CBS 10435]